MRAKEVAVLKMLIREGEVEMIKIESDERMTNVACVCEMNHSIVGMKLKDRGESRAAFPVSD